MDTIAEKVDIQNCLDGNLVNLVPINIGFKNKNLFRKM